ncbi:MAG TPA: hypothetical protein VNZ45_01650 [Bacteroidia bacterium]|jgi:hypothetical protein|nr:hypothetical protein [Bacteroidia bacterium]
MIKFSIDDSQFRSVMEKVVQLGGNMNKHLATSLNKSFEAGRPIAEGAITERYNVTKPNLEIDKASAGNLTGGIRASGGMKKVEEFSPQEGDGGVVSVMIIRGQRKPILPTSRGAGRGAFIVRGGRVMQRKQDEQYPIYPVMTIGYPQMLGSRAVSNPVRDKMGDIGTAELRQQIIRAL